MIASVVIGYFVSIALIASSFYKSRANNYLSLSIFLIATLTFLEWQSINTNTIIFKILSNFRLDALFAVTLFTYFLIQIKHTLLNSPQYKWLYLPFVGFVVLEIPVYYLNLYDSIYDFFIFVFRDCASIVFNTLLIFLGRRFIRNATTISEDKKRWLLRLNFLILSIIICWIFTRLEVYTFQSFYMIYVLWIGMCLFFWWILYYGVFKLQIIAQKEEIHKYLGLTKTTNTKTKKKIKSSTTSKIITQLFKLMEDEELYKNPLLSRLDLATRLETSEGYLSQIINQELNKGVIQFVNEYRVEEAKNLLQDPVFNKYSIEAIGMEAGFKSKSAFYDVFKTSLEMSPGAYRKVQKTS